MSSMALSIPFLTLEPELDGLPLLLSLLLSLLANVTAFLGVAGNANSDRSGLCCVDEAWLWPLFAK